MKKPAVIVVLLGLPASGKSTFARLLSANLSDSSSVIIEYDKLVPLAQQKSFLDHPGEWKAERKSILEQVDQYLNGEAIETFAPNAANRQSQKLTVIIDDNNYYSSMRYEYFQLARKHQTGFCQFFIDVPEKQALSCNESRCQEAKVPDEVIKKMAVKLEKPEPLKNSWEKFSFQIAIKDSLAELKDYSDFCLGMIEMAMRNPVQPLDLEEKAIEEANKDRARLNVSVIHQADKCLRKIIGQKMKEAKDSERDKDELKTRATKLNSVKDELLEDLKTGFAPLPKSVVSGITNKKDDALESLNSVLKELFELKIK